MTFTREYQQTARAHVQCVSLQRAGSKGYLGLVAKRGFYAAAEFVATWRKAHPSSLQRTVREWLIELDEYFLEDEHLRYGLFRDFQLPCKSVIIEVDGHGFHGRTDWLGDNRNAREPLYERSMVGEGYRVLHRAECDMRSGAGKQMLVEFLLTAGACSVK